MKTNRTFIFAAFLAAFLMCGLPHTAQAKFYSDDESANDPNASDPNASDPNANDDNDDHAATNAGKNDGADVNDTDNADNDQDEAQPHSMLSNAPPTPAPPMPESSKPAAAHQAAPAPYAAEPPPPVPAAAPVSPPQPPPPAPIPAAAEPPPPSSHGKWWHPHPGIKWQIQYAGHLDTSAKVQAFDLDMVETDPAIIQQLHNRGVKVICYFSAGSYEGWRPDAREFPASILGKPNGWKDEKWLDIRRMDILRPIMKARIQMAAQKGCDAVDPDNVEAYDNNSGFPLKSSDQIAYNKMIAELAHEAGMAVSLKNDLDQIETLLPYFDFSVNEQCFEYKSCDQLVPFIKAGKPVLNVEYKEQPSQFCPQANKMNFDSVKKNLDLDAKIEYCR